MPGHDRLRKRHLLHDRGKDVLAGARADAAVDGVPKGKGHTTLFAIEAVRGLVGDWMYRCGMSLAEMDEKLPCDEMSVACLMCEHCSLRDTRVEMRVNEAIAKQKAGEAK